MYDCLYSLLIFKVYTIFFRWLLPDYVRFLPSPNFVCLSLSDKKVL